VAEYMQSIADLPSDSLQLPELPPFFAELEGIERGKLVTSDACILWFEAAFCDLGHMARDHGARTGQGHDLCWNEVPLPDFGYTAQGSNLMFDRPPMDSSATDEFEHPEYLACQETPLRPEYVQHWCPMGGHYPDGMWNTSWGAPATEDTISRSSVLTCNRKLGNPEFAGRSDMPFHIADEGEDVDVLKPFRGYVVDIDTVRAAKDLWQNTSMDEALSSPEFARLLTDMGTGALAHAELAAGQR